jgi:hypothetical protein
VSAEAKNARDQLRLCSLEIYAKAVDKHAEGIALTRRATRIEQLAEVASDELAVQFLDALIGEGLIAPPTTINAAGGRA